MQLDNECLNVWMTLFFGFVLFQELVFYCWNNVPSWMCEFKGSRARGAQFVSLCPPICSRVVRWVKRFQLRWPSTAGHFTVELREPAAARPSPESRLMSRILNVPFVIIMILFCFFCSVSTSWYILPICFCLSEWHSYINVPAKMG